MLSVFVFFFFFYEMCAWGQARNVVAGRATLCDTAGFPNLGKGVSATTQHYEIVCSDLSSRFFFSAVIKMTKKNWKITKSPKKCVLQKKSENAKHAHLYNSAFIIFPPHL